MVAVPVGDGVSAGWAVDSGLDEIAIISGGPHHNRSRIRAAFRMGIAGAAVATTKGWTEWKVPLSSFTGVNPTQVRKLSIGVGDRVDPKASVFGRLYIDDIRVEKP